MKKTPHVVSLQVFGQLLKAAGMKKTNVKNRWNQDVYVNEDAEFISVERRTCDIYGNPMVALHYINCRGHRITAKNNAGYFIIHLNKCMTIHRIVAETFLGSIPEGYDVDHIDGDKSNNSVTNLEIITHQENMRRYYERRKAAGIEKIHYKMNGRWMSKSKTFITPDGEKIPMTEQEYIDHLLKTRGKTAVTRFLKRRGGK